MFVFFALVLVVCLAPAPSRADDAGAPDAGPAPSAEEMVQVEALRATTRALQALLEGRLDAALEPAALFDIDLNDASAVRLEVPRLRAVLGGFAGQLAPEGGRLAPILRQAVLERDAARLKFLELPASKRAALLEQHARRAAQVTPLAPQLAAERRAQEARKAEQRAREAALRAHTEAARLLSEEQARLLAVSGAQADFSADLERRRARLSELREVTLGWHRRGRELRDGAEPGAALDGLYDELRRALGLAREQLAVELDHLGAVQSAVPRPEADRLATLPVNVDTTEAMALRTRLLVEADRLEQAERELRQASASALSEQMIALNRERLALLPLLSEDKRDAITGLTLAGVEQAAAELRQLALILRHNRFKTSDWFAGRLSGAGRRFGPWMLQLGVALLEWLVVVSAFVWWRRQSKRRFDAWLALVRRRDRQLRLADASHLERALNFLAKVHRPIEWLLLCAASWWLLPSEAQGLLETQLVAVVLGWVLAGALVVSVINAWADSTPRALFARQVEDASLRLKSLRLVGRVTIGFGLVLSISSRLVGRGTIYEWVLSVSWFAALPIFLILVRWWRPNVFERIAKQRKHTVFERWVLGNRTGWKSFVAAMSGAVFLFGRGFLRWFVRWIGRFDLTRKALAYLFQRELAKLGSERASIASRLEGLPPDVYAALGPEVASSHHVATDTDELVAPLATRLLQGGHLLAVVGERGLGKSTLLDQLEARLPGSLLVRVQQPSLDELAAVVGSRLGARAAGSWQDVARALDAADGPVAVLIDDAQRLVHPVQGGLQSFDRLMAAARAHSRRLSWVFSFQDSIWNFVEQARGACPSFDEVVRIQRWREAQIAELLRARCRQAGLQPSFERLLERLPADADAIDRDEALAERASGYHRLIWDYAGGNPGLALDVWRRALGVDEQGKVWVKLFPTLNTTDLERLPDTAMFVLRAVLQMAPAQSKDIERATLLSSAQVADVLRYALSRGFLEHGVDGYRVSWTWLRPLMRLLNRKHLLASS